MIDPLYIQLAIVIVSAASAGLSARNGQKIKDLHVQINSRMDQWMEKAEQAAHAEGKAEGIAAERVRIPDTK